MNPAVEWISSPSLPRARLSFQSRDEVVRQGYALERRAEHELARVEDERLVPLDLDELGQPFLLSLDVDVGVAGVPEDPKHPVDPHIEARRLHQRGVVRVDSDSACVDQTPDRAVGEHHRAILARPIPAARRPECGTLGDPVSMLYGPMDPNERFRARRDQTRRTKRRRRAAVLALLLLAVIAIVHGRALRRRRSARRRASRSAPRPPATPQVAARAARVHCPSRSGVSTSRARSPRCRGSSGSTSATSAMGSTRSSST